MVGVGVLALQGRTGGSGLVQPGEGVVLGGSQQQPLVPTRTASRKWRWVLHSNAWLEDEEQQTLKQERFRMDVRRNFFPHEYSPAVAQSAHGCRAISILGGFQDPPDTAPGNLVWSHS